MASLLSGLKSLGLDNLENSDIFAEEEKKSITVEKKIIKKPISSVREDDLIFDKEFKCPVCDRSFTAKIMKSNRARLIGTDDDLRPRYEGIDSQKYDVLLCSRCGYAALIKNFPTLLSSQVKLIKDNICANVKLTKYEDPIYSYEEAAERYKLALACAVVKRAKSSEKAMICLKSAWLFRAQREELEAIGEDKRKLDGLLARENEYLENAYKGFLSARESENFPIAGMEPTTLDYLIARLAYRFGDNDCAIKLIGGILTTTCSERIKDRARELKDTIMAEKKNK